MIYLDNAATTSLSSYVCTQLRGSFGIFGNPSSAHKMGVKARDMINRTRKSLLNILSAKSGDVIFTSGGSEANNLAIIGLENYLRKNNKTTIITSKIEHLSVLNSCKHMEDKGFNVIYMPVCYDGRIDIEELDRVMGLNKDTLGLVAIQTVNSEIGTIQNIRDIGDLCDEYGALFMTDAVQAISHMKIDVEECHIDLLTISGHKIHAPKGIGALYVRDRSILSPIILGGGQEYGLRSGTENVIGIMGLGAALEELEFNLSSDMVAMGFMREYTLFLLKNVMKIPYYINCEDSESNIISLTIPKVEGSSLMLLLNDKNIYVSTGSACSSSKLEASYVLKAIGLLDNEAVCTIRISLPRNISRDDLKYAVECMAELSKQLYELTE